MIRDNRIYFNYEGYTDRFGNAKRPALVRYSIKTIPGDRFTNDIIVEIATLFIDGKIVENTLNNESNEFRISHTLVIMEFNHSDKQYNMIARLFNANHREDWYYLFYDTIELQKMGDRMAFSNLAIALRLYNFNNPLLIDIINSLDQERKLRIIELINYIAFSLSVNKIHQIEELNLILGYPNHLFFPAILEKAALQYGLQYEELCVHTIADSLVYYTTDNNIDNPSKFIRFIQWLKDETMSISLQELEDCFAFLGEGCRTLAIRRFFYDVKNGRLSYDNRAIKAFSSQNFQYYSTLRYVFEEWPANRNVSTEFLFDCLKTYEQTNQHHFQVSEGILDWSIQKASELSRPIEMNFSEWLYHCEGGILINKNFKGFVDFYVQSVVSTKNL